MDEINMTALKTFYGANGYIAAGERFFVRSREEANRLARENVAYFQDPSQREDSQEMDLKKQTISIDLVGSGEVSIKQIERNVTSYGGQTNQSRN